jgi:endonuclease G
MVERNQLVFAEVENIVRDRLKKKQKTIETSLTHIAEGNPLASETKIGRRLQRLQTKASLSREEAVMISAAIDAAAERKAKPSTTAKAVGPEAIRGGTLDFVGVAFLQRGRQAADAVGRVAFLSDAPQGTGFLVGPGLFLTNHHVIESQSAARRLQVQFDYEYDPMGRAVTPTSFFFDPDTCFVTDGIQGLDYTLIAIGERRSGTRALSDFGFVPLSDAGDKHMLGEIANVVQHPDGRFKELVLRENHLVARDETLNVLHYVADTEQGSSGSPVFNNEWEAIALHHWGGPWREVMSTKGKALATEINEGIRISAIVGDLRRRSLNGPTAAAVRRILDLWDAGGRRPVSPAPAEARTESAPAAPLARRDEDGTVTWTFPVEISVRAPLLAPAPQVAPPMAQPAPQIVKPARSEAASWKTENFDDRAGYEPGFVPGFVLALPDFSGVSWRAAKNQLPLEGDDPHELRYHHFSIVMNADRRLAGFTAVNIDGKRIKAVNRDDKTVIDDPTLKDLGVESLGLNGAEASDAFRPDRRVLPEEQMTKPFYDKQVIPGFPDANSSERKARMFQKGHIILRGDPAWGTEDEAVAAERDTFFYTNAAPQVGFFNQGSALNRPGSKGKLRWRAVETFILRNAVTMRSRVSVFAGPVFDDRDDPSYRFDSKVPMRFWKIAAWSDGSALRSIALLADQRPVLKVMPEGIGMEAFGDEEELARVSEFLSTVEQIEHLTGLDFGSTIRGADIRAGAPTDRDKPALTLPASEVREPGPARASRRPATRKKRTTPKRKR